MTQGPRVLPHLSRRTLLRGAGVAGAGIVLAACGGSDGTSTDATETDTTGTGDASGSPVDGEQAVNDALGAAGIEGPPVLTVLVATFEMMTGEGQRMQFALLDESGSPMVDEEVQAFLVRDGDGDREVAVGPANPTFYGEELGDRGVYVFEAGLDQPGLYDLVVATPDKARAGTAAVRVIRPEESALPLTGDAFPAVDTPTTEDPKDLDELCTRDTNCGMHDTSLTTALEEGSPVVLTIATPKYCSSRICGPVVDVVLGVKEQAARDDVVFIHAEVFSDAGSTPTQIVNELQLPTEPWTFVINADGTLADRFDGPVVPQFLAEAISEV